MSDVITAINRPHGEVLGILARANKDALSACAETVLPQMPDIEVLHNRTGLVMQPMRDTAQGASFHLGEVLVAEAHIRAGDAIGYGMRRGRDLSASMAMAVIDLAISLGVACAPIAQFLDAEAVRQADEDREALRRVEATRVEMETF